MEIYLNKKLKNIYDEICQSPNANFLIKKSSKTTEFKIVEWMQRYVSVYHQLVKEFNPNKINYKKNIKKSNTAKSSSLYDLFSQLYANYPDIKIPGLENNHTKNLGDWFNEFNSEIFDNNPSFISLLNEMLNDKSQPIKFRRILAKIIKHLEGCNKFMSLEISDELNEGMEYTYKYNDSSLSFTIHSNKFIDLDNIYWRFLYARMKSISRLYVQNKNPNKIQFEIFLSDIEKKLPKKNGIFGPREINSGCTDYETIIIWRKEEHLKLILHESIHFYNLDGSYDLFNQNENINLECHYQIGANNATRIYEAYTESLTVFLNSFANSYQIHYLENPNIINQDELTVKDFNNINNIRNYLWNLEKRFTLIQISKIILHVNPDCNDFRDFLVDPDKCTLQRSKMKHKLEQRTSVLSYHILKGSNMIFEHDFIEWIPNLYNPHPKSLYNFFNYVTGKTHDETLIKLINATIKYLKSLKSYNRNLRMTFYESNILF